MNIEMLEYDKEKGKLSFLLKESSAWFANTLRRMIIEEVPTMAIEDVEFHDNSSALYDEIVAHRLGLIPLRTDLQSYSLPSECTCKGKGCARCQLKMSLKAKGPCVVYADEIKSKDPKVKPVFGKIPIVKLLKGQKLEFEATAMLGQGKEHTKWSPGLAWYKSYPVIEIQGRCENAHECVAACPVNVFEVKDGEIKIKKDNILKCHLCNACVDASNGTIKVEPSSTDFIFTIESWGQLEPKEIVRQAVEMFVAKVEAFTKSLKE